MGVSYVHVDRVVDIFAPVSRAFGNIAIIGSVEVDDGAPVPEGPAPGAQGPGVEVSVGGKTPSERGTGPASKVPGTTAAGPATATTTEVESPAEPAEEKPPAKLHTPRAVGTPDEATKWFPGTLAKSIAVAFKQTPGPSRIYGIGVDAQNPNWEEGLKAAETLDAQFVVLASTTLDAAGTSPQAAGTRVDSTPGPIQQLADHVATTSTTGDGSERMGVAMLPKGSDDVSAATALGGERMVYVAHGSEEDAAAAVAGTIAGYEPHISPLLKPVNIKTESFTATQIGTINGKAENPLDGPTGQGVVWLTHPTLIPGSSAYLGEAYTGDPKKMKYIDIVRTVDDVTFRLKARLINTIGNLRMSRSGLRSLVAQLEAELDPLVRREVIDDYQIVVPLIALLDKEPDAQTPSEQEQIKQTRGKRVVEVLVAINYAGAIHRIAMTLKFS